MQLLFVSLPYISERNKDILSFGRYHENVQDYWRLRMNQGELETYIQQYGKDLYSFCCSITYNMQEADDLYQDTFVKAYEMQDDVVIERNPKSFLMSVAINLYRNYKRKLSIRQRIIGIGIELEEEITEVPSMEQLTEEKVVAKEVCQMVRQAVEKLPDKYKIPILLFYMEDLAIADISEILKLPEGTIKSRIHRAKKILKQKLEESHYEK